MKGPFSVDYYAIFVNLHREFTYLQMDENAAIELKGAYVYHRSGIIL